jgi:hypothetical protein
MSFTDLITFDAVSIRRPSVSQDSSGGATHLPFVEEESVPARVEALNSMQRLQYDQLVVPVTHRVFIDDVTLVANGYILVTSDNLVLRVVGIEQQRGLGGIDNYAAVLAEEIKV